MPRISKFQMTEGTSWSGYTSQNHLGAIYEQHPQVADKMINRIMVDNMGMDLEGMLNQYPTLYLENDNDFTWKLQGSGRKNVPLVEARIAGSVVVAGDEPGKANSEFELVFADAWFTDVNLIVGERNEVYRIQILDDPTPDGSYWVYRVKLFGVEDDAFMPVEELAAGKRFSREYSPVEQELSRKGGGINFTTPFDMRNTFTMIRLQHTAAGNMLNRTIGGYVKEEDGSTIATWTDVEDYEFEKQYRLEKNRQLMFGRANRREDGTYSDRGKSGNVIKTGAGLREQMESANEFGYNIFTIDWLNETLLQLSVGKVNQDNRRFLMVTGEYGAVQFHKAIEDYSQLYTANLTDKRFGGDVNNMSYGGQFKSFNGPNGIVVDLMVSSLYDDTERNKIMKLGGSGVAESYRYDIFDFGTTNGSPNIQKVAIKGAEYIRGYESGFRNKYVKPEDNTMMTTPIDGYTMHKACNIGLMVKDPSKTATLMPNELRM